jgi:hypothetical protein
LARARQSPESCRQRKKILSDVLLEETIEDSFAPFAPLLEGGLKSHGGETNKKGRDRKDA